MSAPLWSREELLRVTAGTASGDWSGVSGVSIDTRTIEKGDLFVALKDQRDGHEFVAAALESGAGAALVSRQLEGVSVADLLLAEDALIALERIGRAGRARISNTTQIIAVTGSAGKTSVKESLLYVLGKAGQGGVHASVKSYNNHWGVPLSLARMPAETRYGILEIGMNHAGEITPLSQMVAPHIAVITTIAPAHLGNFNNEEEIALAKAEIFDGMNAGGKAVLNADNPWFDLLSDKARDKGLIVHSFGTAKDAAARLIGHDQQASSAQIEAEILGEAVRFSLTAPGTHHAMNALAVLLAGKLVGADFPRMAEEIGHWVAGDGRGARQSIRLDPDDAASAFTLIDESYNANPASMRAAFEVLGLAEVGANSKGAKGRRIAVLGEMRELGEGSTRLHADLASSPELGGVDLVYCCGPDMRALDEALPAAKRGGWAADSTALAEIIAAELRGGDVVMVKGSFGSAMRIVIERLAA